jgi:hypothetical protein
MKLPSAAVLLMMLPMSALATTVWRGDFETRDLSQWSGKEAVAAERLQVVADPTREGRYALKVTVKKGDDPINASGNRNELFHFGNESEGEEYYYKWSTQFSADYPSADTWQLFTQWHHDGPNGSPPLEFFVWGERIFLRLEGRDDRVVWSAPLVRGQWQDFILHVKWSSSPKVGFVELYYNGELVLPRQFSATLFRGMQNYLKQGLYRDESIGETGVVYHDGMIQATSLEDVLPPASVEPPPVAAPVTPPAANGAPVLVAPTPPASPVPAPEAQPSLAVGTPGLGAADETSAAAGCSTAGGSLGGMGALGLILAALRLRRRATPAP